MMTSIIKTGAVIALTCTMSWHALAQPLEISASTELIWDQTKGLYEASGDAVAIRGNQTISADVLTAYYNRDSANQDVERIIADTNVRFTDGDLNGSGARLDYNVTSTFYELTGPNARLSSKDGKAKAEKTLSFDRATGIIIAQQKGEILLSDGRLLKGNFIEITLSDTEEIETVMVSGNVAMRQADGKEAYSDEGVYNAKTGKAVLTGSVKIIEGDSILNGQKAEIDFNKGISRLVAGEQTGRVSGILATSD